MDAPFEGANADALGITGIDGNAHHAVHILSLARLVFIPEHDGCLHRCTIDAIEAGHNVTSRSEKTEGEHDRPPRDGQPDASMTGGDDGEEIAA